MVILVLEGNIGATKTTIGNKILNELRQRAKMHNDTAYSFETRGIFRFIFIPEDLNTQKLTEFYNNPRASSFEFQKYMLQRARENYQKAKKFSESNYLVLLDRNLIGYTVFLKILHKQSHLSEDQYKYLTQEVQKINPQYDKILHVQDHPLACLKRIRQRNRPYEQTITIDYLQQINMAYNQILSTYHNVQELFPQENKHMDIIEPYITKLSLYV